MRTRKIQDYGIAVVTVMAMIVLHALLVPLIGPTHNSAYMICAVAVTLATAGPGPAILTAVLAFACTVTLFGDPGSLSAMGGSGPRVNTLMYSISCAVIIALGAWQVRRSRHERVAHARDVQMLELVTDCFFVLDREWRFAHINGPGRKYFNKQPQQGLGHNIWDVFPTCVGSCVDVLFRQVASSGEAARSELLGPLTRRW